jgi:hypothetical protein
LSRTATEAEIVRGLLERHGRTFGDELGINLARGTPSALFQWLCASMLYGARVDSWIACEALRNLKRRRWHTARAMARSASSERVAALNRAGYAGSQERVASMLGQTAEHALGRWHGDLRRLRQEAGRDPGRERTLLREFKGIGDVSIDIFFREVQAIWPELAPFADGRALRAARQLGLGSTPRQLRARVASDQEFVRLVAALVRADLEGEPRTPSRYAWSTTPDSARTGGT